jgi:hypothetical protein
MFQRETVEKNKIHDLVSPRFPASFMIVETIK